MISNLKLTAMSSAKVTLVHYKYKTYSNGKHPIMIRITANRKSRYMSTGYSAKPENWDEDNNRLVESRSKSRPNKIPMTNAKAINTDLELKYNEVLRVKQQVSLSDGVQSSDTIKSNASLKYKKASNFFDYSKTLAQTFLDRNKICSYKNITSVLKRLKEYMNSKELLFSDIDEDFIEKYKTHLIKGSVSKEGKKIPGLGNNTISYQLKSIRAILYRAMNEKVPLISRDKNPFNTVKIKYSPTKKETLSLNELDKLRKVQLDLKTQHRLIDVRNYYFFSFNNAGIRVSDLIQLKVKNIVDGRLHYEMGKTGHFKSILLNTESLSIIKQYVNPQSKPNDYLFPILSKDEEFNDAQALRNKIESKNAMINENLKKLAFAAELEKRLHFHSSRHSFSNIARKKKADLYGISKALGHKSIKVTEMYLASFDEEALDETMQMILGK